jgi:predicted RND superfamily exporter protein
MNRLQSLIKNRSGFVIAVFAILTVLAAAAATGVKIDGSVEHLMMSDDPARALDAEAKEEFGNDEVIVVAFDLGHPYGAADLRKLRDLSAEIAAIPGIDRVKDLSNTEDIRGTEDALDASPLVSFDALDEEIDAIKVRTRDHRLYDRSLISIDQDVFGMFVYAEDTGANTKEMNELTVTVLRRVDELASP